MQLPAPSATGTTPTASPRRLPDIDRLGLSLLVAIVIHAMLLIGLDSRTPATTSTTLQQTLAVNLIKTPGSATAPATADYIAETNQHARQPPQPGQSTEAKRQSQAASPTSKATPPQTNPPQVNPTQTNPPRSAGATQPRANQQHHNTAAATPSPSPVSNGHALAARSLELARTSPALQQAEPTHLPSPNEATHNTVATVGAGYLANWKQKVKRIGQLNYPAEARRRGIRGYLTLRITLNADGELEQAHIVQSSGYDILDQAALHIVRLAAPYGDFPPALRNRSSQLTFERKWVFGPPGFATQID